jgi:hypothetical protein
MNVPGITSSPPPATQTSPISPQFDGHFEGSGHGYDGPRYQALSPVTFGSVVAPTSASEIASESSCERIGEGSSPTPQSGYTTYGM